MKRYLLLISLIATTLGFSQDKVVWNVAYNAAAHQVEFKATIAEGWHLYSQFIQEDVGPVPTAFVFREHPSVSWEGKVTEPAPISKYDENFEASLEFFKDEVTFARKIKPGSKGTISGSITYMICNDVMCLPPVDYEFSINIP